MYEGKITASSGRGPDAIKVVLDDPVYKPDMTLKDWVAIYGKEVVLSHFLASRTIAIQKPMQGVLKSEGGTVEQAIAAGAEKAKDLTVSRRSGATKSKRQTRAEIEKTFVDAKQDVSDEIIKGIIDNLLKS